jgi:hypothetical protein
MKSESRARSADAKLVKVRVKKAHEHEGVWRWPGEEHVYEDKDVKKNANVEKV